MKAFLVLLIGWLADRLLGDPSWLPHPIVGFGKIIALFERLLNRGRWRKFKGAVVALVLIAATFVGFWFLLRWIDARSVYIGMAVKAVFVFYCLAGTTLIREVREVFHAVDRSLEEGRRQVARIVGRDTSQLSAQEVRTAALETLAENLSDGVVAPLFWYALLGVPGMMTYKMINTLDSMIGYKTERYREFGCWAARIDDIANYVPARLTALMMLLVAGRLRVLPFVTWFGRQNASPNSGYPEAALAGILDCRFGGPHTYFGEYFEKPYIGTKARELTTADMELSVRINRRVENLSVVIILIVRLVRFAILYVFFW
ncbi:MAG: adenosylcobinamide-phosphate synthase CbiB [Prevotella sp.]|nr:adenosylcobinamide-phosphate synthase CbiB [Prevotella sp.]